MPIYAMHNKKLTMSTFKPYTQDFSDLHQISYSTQLKKLQKYVGMAKKNTNKGSRENNRKGLVHTVCTYARFP